MENMVIDRKLTNQSYKRLYAENELTNIKFENKIPRTQAERNFFNAMNSLFKDFGLFGIINWVHVTKVITNKNGVKRFNKLEWTLIINSGENLRSEVKYGSLFINDLFNGEYNYKMKFHMAYKLFGDHYLGHKSRMVLNELNSYKMLLELSKHQNMLKDEKIKAYEQQIVKIYPSKRVKNEAIINDFMSRKSKLKICS